MSQRIKAVFSGKWLVVSESLWELYRISMEFYRSGSSIAFVIHSVDHSLSTRLRDLLSRSLSSRLIYSFV